MPQLPRSEFAQALTALAAERGLTPEVLMDQLKLALIGAYRREMREQGVEVAEEEEFTAEINSLTGEVSIFKVEGKKKTEVTPPGFTRIAAQTFRQIFRQKTREVEKEAILAGFESRIGQLVSGVILRFDGQNARVDLGKTEALFPAGERIPNERLELSQRLTFLLKEIREGAKGKDLIVSRADPEFVKKLFAREVPEIAGGSVEIYAIAREPGVRTKIAVKSSTSGVDPVGSCVGQKGVRVQAVINELGGEKIDVIPWTDEMTQLITSALAPAQNLSVSLDPKNKKAIVKAPTDQLSLAIGKEGQNVRLAAILTGFDIDIEGSESPIKEPDNSENSENQSISKPVEPEHEQAS
ncbi:transcription termination factor NusA [Candidatus Microgenomates bacterium]|nr:transcription termination factor NusA [Candidatus Microgenomates bacterium]